MIWDRIVRIPRGTAIPKPQSCNSFRFLGTGRNRRGEERVGFTIPNHKNPEKPQKKWVTKSQLETAYKQLTNGELTKAWWEENVGVKGEGGCTFTTVGGLFVHLGEAEYAVPGVYRRLTTKAGQRLAPAPRHDDLLATPTHTQHVILHEEEGRFWAEVPALPGCFSMGDSREEVLANIKEAIACHLDPPTEAKPLKVLVEEVEA